MEFFLGFAVTVAAMYVFSIVNRKKDKDRPVIKIRFGQSFKFELTKFSYFSPYDPKKRREAQSYKHLDSLSTKILVLNSKAYWIQPNGLHTANIVDGVLDQNSTKIVDTMAMDDVELKQIIYVIDQLTEGNSSDPRSPGN